LRVAISASRRGTVFEGHFAHAEVFKIYDYEEGKGLVEVETRENPFGSVPDIDYQEESSCCLHSQHGEQEAYPHGIDKYVYLREKVLSDVDVIIAGGACRTSYAYFTSQGVKLLFAQIVPLSDIEKFIKEDPKSFKELLENQGPAPGY
jgi:predicted Fe-Mo cluster-binding NifX family protein